MEKVKIFLSYSEKDKHLAGKLKRCLEEYENVTCFVAHDDIISGSQWEHEMLENLKTANYFMPLQTQELSNSFWCQQEAGIAIASNISIIPLIPDEGGTDPVGFYARYQGARLKVGELRISVKNILIQQAIIQAGSKEEEIEAHVLIFERSNSWAEAAENIKNLLRYEDELTNAQIMRISEAANANDQIISSFAAAPYIRNFLKRHVTIIPRQHLEKYL